MERNVIKVVIVGESGVGKTGICCRFTEGTFDDEARPTIGCDFKTKTLTVDGVEVNLAVYDTAGQERFQSLAPTFYRNAKCAVLVYDTTNRKSFLKLNTWLEVVQDRTDDIVLMVVGNKSDLKESREVTEKDGINFARSINSLFMETSAKDSIGINEAFTELVRKVMQTPHLWHEPMIQDVVSLHTSSDNSSESSCSLKC